MGYTTTEYSIMTKEDKPTLSCIKDNLNKMEQYKKLSIILNVMESKGYKLFKADNGNNLAFKGFNEFNYILLNLNNGIYYNIDLEPTLNHFLSFTDVKEKVNPEDVEILNYNMKLLDIDFIENHNNNMGSYLLDLDLGEVE